MSLNNIGFAELTHDEMLSVDGGGWGSALITIGGIALFCTGVVALSTVAAPAVGGAAIGLAIGQGVSALITIFSGTVTTSYGVATWR